MFQRNREGLLGCIETGGVLLLFDYHRDKTNSEWHHGVSSFQFVRGLAESYTPETMSFPTFR